MTRNARLNAAVVAGAVILFTAHAYALRFTQDDAFISLHYARHLVEGHGLVFNVGERVEGYSNFAWTLLLAMLLRLDLPAMDIARIAGVACAAAAIVVAARFARSVDDRSGLAAAGTAALAAASSPLAMWSTSGMETGFHTLIVTAALAAAFTKEPSSRSRGVATLLFAFAALSRPDAPVFFAGWIGTRVADVLRRRADAGDSLRAILRDVACFAAPLVPYVAGKLLYYGEVVPNTYYAKSGLATTYIARGLLEAKDYALRYGAAFLAPALAWMATRRRTAGPRLLRLLIVLAGHALYVVVVGGDVLPLFRFWLPILPMSCALIAVGAGVAADAIVRRADRRRLLVSATLAGIIAAGFLLNADDVRAHRRAMSSTLAEHVGVWLGKRLGPDEAIAATPIGAIAYFSRRPVIDMLGLVDREIARNPEPLVDVTDTWREKKYNAASVLRRRPAAIFFSTGIRPSAAGEQALFLYEDFHRSYYPQYIRPDPTIAQPATIYRLRPNAPAPPDTLRAIPEREFLQHWCRGLLATLRDGDPPAAVLEFERAVKTSPPFFVDAMEWWAATRYELGDESAVPVLRDVLRLDPYSLLASFRLGHYLLVRDRLAECEEVFLAHVAINPDEARAWQFLAEVSARQGRYAEALERIERSLMLWSTNEPGAAMRRELLAELKPR